MRQLAGGSPWYHGSPLELTVLRAGSSITQDPAVARAFSHRPALVAMEDDGTIRHDGTMPGYLYRVAEAVRPEDVYPHPHPANATRWEWLTRRELRLELVERTEVSEAERLSEQAIERLRRKQQAKGEESFAEGGAL